MGFYNSNKHSRSGKVEGRMGRPYLRASQAVRAEGYTLNFPVGGRGVSTIPMMVEGCRLCETEGNEAPVLTRYGPNQS